MATFFCKDFAINTSIVIFAIKTIQSMAKVTNFSESASDSLQISASANEKGIEIIKSVADFYKAVPMTTSLNVANIFGKQHKHVLRDIKELDCSDDFRESNFGLSFIIRELPTGGSKQEPYYTITRDGFTFLAMGYRGKKAAEFKEAYIKAFNEMERELNNWKQTRCKAKEIRKSLTDAIKNNLDTSKPFVYSNYTKLAVRKAFGKSIEQMGEEKSISNVDNLRDFLNSEEVKKLEYFESKIAGMVDTLKILGMDDKDIYDKIKKANIK